MFHRIAARTNPLFAALVACCTLSIACSDESDEEVHHDEPAEDCQAIGDVCTHDTPGELAAECHEVSHDNDAEICGERRQECVEHCAQAMGEGGAGGAD